MLVIHRRGSCNGGAGRYYSGSGMFDGIGRKLFSSGIKKAISSGTSSAIAHKVADAVVNGATSTSKKVVDAILKGTTAAVEKATASVVNEAIDSVVKKLTKKRSLPETPPHPHEPVVVVVQPIIKKLYIDSVIDGSGILFE